MRLPLPLLALLAVTGVAPLAAQVLPLTVPRGKLRVDFHGRFESFDRRWNDGVREEWAGDFDGRPFDRSVVPGLAEAESRLRNLTGLGDVGLSLGTGHATQLVNRGTAGVGGAFGLTRWLTVFATVPVVRIAAKTQVTLDGATGNAGPNAADPVFGTAAGRAEAAAFLGALGQAAATLQARVAAGDFDADPSLKALAQQTVARADNLSSALFDLLLRPGTASPFLPRIGTPVAAALVQVVQQLQGTFAGSFGISGFTALPPLPSAAVSTDGLLAFVTSPDGPVVARPFDEIPKLSYLGDIELGAVVSLADRFPAARYGRGIRSALETTVRLRTARLDRPDRFLDLGTGDRQPDLEVRLVTDVALGRVGARVSAGYNLQLPGNQNRRVAPAGQLAPAASLAAVRCDPGDELHIGARPFFRLAPFLALSASADYWRRGTDRYSYVAGQPPIEGVDLAVLALGSRADALVLGGALGFAHSGLDRHGTMRLPLDASVRYERVARSGMGLVSDSHLVRVDLRFYTGLLR